MKQMRPFIVCVIAIISIAALNIAPAAAASKTLEWTRLDSDITVQTNGDLRIVETNVIHFTSGAFTFGYRDINMDRLTNVTAIQVTENNKALKIETSRQDSSTFRIKYYFSTASNEERTFKVAYTIQGATRYYSGGDQVYWAAVYADRNGFSVQNSRVTVNLPAGATATQAATYGASATVTGNGESTIIAVAKKPISSGTQLEIRVQFPHGIITGAPPSWQAAYDEQRNYDETTKPLIDFIVLMASLVILFGGPALVILLWYTRGRDPNVGLVADYLTEPPSGIKPGIAGPLISERTDLKDIIATLVDLARRGILTMTETGKSNRSGLVYDRDWVFERGPNFGAPLNTYESKLIDAMDLVQIEQRRLSALKNKIYRQIEPLKKALYDELAKDGYYVRSPAATRSRYSGYGCLLLIATMVVVVIAIGLIDFTNAGICIPAALGITTVFFFAFASAMPARTRQGAEAKMRTLAFKKYLQNIEKYVDLKTATNQFDKYLPYAIAFGLDRSWINKFAAVSAPAPTWYVPYIPFGYGYGLGGRHSPSVSIPAGQRIGDVSGAARAPASLEGLDKSLSSGLSSMNAGLSAMFTSVASTFVSTPAPPPGSSSSGGGGGWSGGGGGGGGSSGGGGGGFG